MPGSLGGGLEPVKGRELGEWTGRRGRGESEKGDEQRLRRNRPSWALVPERPGGMGLPQLLGREPGYVQTGGPAKVDDVTGAATARSAGWGAHDAPVPGAEVTPGPCGPWAVHATSTESQPETEQN